MSDKRPEDSEIFRCSDKTELYLLAMEYPHKFGLVKDYLIKECSRGKLSGKTYGYVRYFLDTKFGKCDDINKYFKETPKVEED